MDHDKKFFDIFRRDLPPKPKVQGAAPSPTSSSKKLWLGAKKKTNLNRQGSGWGAFLIAAIMALVFLGYAVFKSAKSSFSFITNRFQEAVEHLHKFEFGKANESFLAANGAIQNFDFLKTASDAFTTLGLLGERAVNLSGDLVDLSGNGFSWIVNQRGEELIAKIDNLKNNLQQVALLSGRLQEQVASFNYKLDDRYLDLSADLHNKYRMLEALSGWLKAEPARHFLVLFQNSSEIRPGGGFIGSYAHVILNNGNLTSIDVRDIYDPDGQLAIKVIPPKPLQAITARWGARDANWFFNFPDSAAKVIEFLESSKIYSERGVKFGGALAINMDIVRDFLAVTGPIWLEKYNLELDSQNVLAVLQQEVEAGEEKKIGKPKRILSVLTPILFEKIGNLSDKQKQTLAVSLKRRSENKDLMLYFQDLVVESYLKESGIGGEMVALPDYYAGNYLAVVNANIGGHKTDAFIEQAIKVESVIGMDGEVTTTVNVARKHTGQDRKEWWYNAPNKNYMQIFTPVGAKLVESEGGSIRKINQPVDYKKLGYAADEAVAIIEATTRPLARLAVEEYVLADRTVFAAWFNTLAGGESGAVWKYKLGQPMEIKEGAKHEFIFEKQSGVNSKLNISIAAPDGYVWRENGKRFYEQNSTNAPRRLRLQLTLRKAGTAL